MFNSKMRSTVILVGATIVILLLTAIFFSIVPAKRTLPPIAASVGTPGVNCWDLNENGECDLETEDIDLDGDCNVTDCRGPPGLAVNGTDGIDGVDGFHCWDLNMNGNCDLDDEDIDLDGNCTITDCRGLDGFNCWDLNQNHICNLGSEDINSDGACNVTDCRGAQGPAGTNGSDGMDGANGINGTNGVDGFSCWDTNQNYNCDSEEDINLDSTCDVLDCQGPAGINGTNGANGVDGFNCWDLNMNHVCNLGSEDIDQDGNCTILDCRWTNGTNGFDCWDLNMNRACDLPAEDLNEDGDCSTLDCRGPSGSNGTDGIDGFHCWDLNQNHACNLGTEDINGDGACNVTDCTGLQGIQGIQGIQGDAGTNGTDGFDCWDLNQNHVCDLGTEDTDGSGACNVTDCLYTPSGDIVTTEATQTITSKTLDAPLFSGVVLPSTTGVSDLGNSGKKFRNGFFSGNVNTTTLNNHATPAGTGDIVTTDATQTLTSKTLSAPTISGPILTSNLIGSGAPSLGTSDGYLLDIWLVGWIKTYINTIFEYYWDPFTFQLNLYPGTLTRSNTVRLLTNSTFDDTIVLERGIQTLANKTYSGGTFSPTEVTATVTFSWSGSGSSGSTGSGALSYHFNKFGNMVHMHVPVTNGTNGSGGAAFISGATDVPSGYRPTSDQYCAVGAYSLNGAWQTNAVLRIASGGQMQFGTDASLNAIPASNTLTVRAFTCVYYIG